MASALVCRGGVWPQSARSQEPSSAFSGCARFSALSAAAAWPSRRLRVGIRVRGWISIDGCEALAPAFENFAPILVAGIVVGRASIAGMGWRLHDASEAPRPHENRETSLRRAAAARCTLHFTVRAPWRVTECGEPQGGAEPPPSHLRTISDMMSTALPACV